MFHQSMEKWSGWPKETSADTATSVVSPLYVQYRFKSVSRDAPAILSPLPSPPPHGPKHGHAGGLSTSSQIDRRYGKGGTK